MKSVVSVVIVTYNSSLYIKNCLESVFASPFRALEVIVVDNNSSDETREVLLEYRKKIRLFFQKSNIGFAEGCNIGVKKAKGKYILFLNPDTQVTRDFLQPLVRVLESSSKVAAAQPLVKLLNDKNRINLSGKVTHFLGFDWIKDYKSTRIPDEGEITSFSGSAVLIKRRVFEELGGYDPYYFMYFEDSDLSWRIRLAGYRLVLVPESVIYHDYKYLTIESYQSLRQKLYYCERNRLVTILKNYHVKTLILLIPAIVLVESGMIVYSFLKGWGSKKLRSYVNIIENILVILSSRRFVQSIRKIDDALVTEAFVSGITFENFNVFFVRYFINPILAVYWRLILRIL